VLVVGAVVVDVAEPGPVVPVVPVDRGVAPPAGQVTALLTVALGAPVQFPAFAVTVTYTVSSSVVVVRVVDVPVTDFVSENSPRARPDATVYSPAPVTPVQLTGMVAVVVRPLVVHVIVPITTPVGVPIWPARAVAVPVFWLRHAAAATPPPASSSVVTTTAARTPSAGRLTRS
jgi:hypothetical protein